MDLTNINCDDFNTNLCDGLQSLLASSEMSDVTLAVEGRYFKAHQIILSMFSTYFRELFHVTPSRNTIFFMKNVKHRIMHNLLVFMYEGKVQIPSEDVQLFVDTADELKIKGLTNDMVSTAADISRGQVNNAHNIEQVIDIAPSLKRASEKIKQKPKRYKPSNNESVQSSSESSVLNVETNEHRRETDDFNLYGIQLKDEVSDTIDVDHIEMYALDDKTNDWDGEEDNTITSTESASPLASSQIEHLVIGEMEESDIDENQPSDTETKEVMDLIDVGPTEIQGLDDETMKLDGDKEENTMVMGNDKDVNDLLPIDHLVLQPYERKPVTGWLCFSQTGTKKLKSLILGEFRYYFKYDSKLYTHWACTSESKNCKAKLLWAVEDGLITLRQGHIHDTSRNLNRGKTNLESRTLYEVSDDYFRRYVKGKWKTSEASVLTLETNKHRRETDTDTIGVGPTDMIGLDDNTNEMDGNTENTTTKGNEFLVAIDHDPLPPPSEGIPVTIVLCKSQITKKLKSLIWGNFRYCCIRRGKLYNRWRCTGYTRHKCKATVLCAVENGLISLMQSHNHEPVRFFRQTATNQESRTLKAVSYEYFKKHIEK